MFGFTRELNEKKIQNRPELKMMIVILVFTKSDG